MQRFLIQALIAAAIAVPAAAQSITHVYNAGYTSGGYCPGLEIIVTGTNLEPSSGSSVVTVGGQQATIIQPGSGYLIAVIPSTLGTGSTTLTVSYNGQTSNEVMLNLDPYAPEFEQINSAYLFPVCTQCYTQVNTQPPGINAANPATPGGQAGAVVLGLGANPTSSQVTVSVGGETATGVSLSGDDSLDGGYDVVFNVPGDLPAGSYATVVSIGGYSSFPRTLYIGAVQPSITSGGIVPIDSTSTTIQPGSWVSIYGTNLAGGTAIWNGNFPTTLNGTSVTIDGIPAYLWYVSPGQINLQAPDDSARGTVAVVVTTNGVSTTSSVTLGSYSPSFSLLDQKHVAGIILRQNGTGAYGGGTYDIVGPAGNSLGYPTVPAKAGDSLELYGVGFGPTSPVVLSGQAYSGAAATTSAVQLTVHGVSITPSFAGLTSAGLYQINFTLPAGLGSGDVPLAAMVGGIETPSNVVLSVQ